MISKKIFSIFKSIIGLFRSKAYGLIKDINIEKNVVIGSRCNFILNSGTLFINKGVRIRDSFGCVLDGGTINIMEGTFINSGVSLNTRVKIVIEKNCHIGPNVLVFDHDHKFGKNVLIKKSGFSEKEIHIGENVWIGANVVILKGVKIGNNAVIGAGIVVRESVPSNHLLSHKGLTPLR